MHLAPPPVPAPTTGPTVAWAWPVDLRPPAEQRARGRYWGNGLPIATIGDDALDPDPLVAVRRTLTTAAPTAPWDDADLRARAFVLHHVGRRDVSDATWVATATGGLAGQVGHLFFPGRFQAEAVVRVALTDRAGHAVVRDLRATETVQAPDLVTWSLVWAFVRSPPTRAFTAAFTAVHDALAAQARALVAEVAAGAPVTAGSAPTPLPERAVTPILGWGDGPALLVGPETRAEVVSDRLGPAAFSVVTGSDTPAGVSVGTLTAAPDGLSMGYDLGVSDRTQVRVLLDALEPASLAGGLGLRTRVARAGGATLALEGSVGAAGALFAPRPPGAWIGAFAPHWDGPTARAAAVVAGRHRAWTAFARAGGSLAWRPPAGGLPGALTPLGHLAPGVAVQLGPAVAVSLALEHDLAPPGVPVGLPTPQLTVGLR